MRVGTLVACVVVALVAVSCNENSQPGSQNSSSAAGAVKSGGGAQAQAQGSSGGANQRTGQGNQQAVGGQGRQSFQSPVPPADAKWSILCEEFNDPAHVSEATMLKSRLVQTTGSNDWYVIHTETQSSIYYGYYRDLDNPAEKKRAEADRTRVGALTDARGNPLLRGNILVPVARPDPEAPAEWNLLNTPQDAYWTIEIATFAGNAKRKEAAVEMVRELRAEGKRAYFYHGETASSVCIGAWKRSAVAEQGTGFNNKGQTRDDAHTQSPDTPLLVMPDVLPPNMPSRVLEPGTGKPMTVMGFKLQIVDPDMKKTVEDPKFQYHMTNYEYRGTQEGQPDPSVLVAIPHQQSVAREEDWRLNGGGATGQPQVEQRKPSAAGDNVLRSIGDH
jgi:hypothetical protein